MTDNVTPDFRAARNIASQSARLAAIGFSTITCKPASAARTADSACNGCGVQTNTASAPASQSILPTLSNAFPPYFDANRSALSKLESTHATNSDSAKLAKACACNPPTFPQPINAVRTRFKRSHPSSSIAKHALAQQSHVHRDE